MHRLAKEAHLENSLVMLFGPRLKLMPEHQLLINNEPTSRHNILNDIKIR